MSEDVRAEAKRIADMAAPHGGRIRQSRNLSFVRQKSE
jgi:hypothetical protein